MHSVPFKLRGRTAAVKPLDWKREIREENMVIGGAAKRKERKRDFCGAMCGFRERNVKSCDSTRHCAMHQWEICSFLISGEARGETNVEVNCINVVASSCPCNAILQGHT